MHFTLFRVLQPSTQSGAKQNYLNRIADGQGETLYSGITPQRHFTAPVVFKDTAEETTITFAANRGVAPSAYTGHNSNGDELFRIDLPVAAKLRPRASLSLSDATTGQHLELVPSHVAAGSEPARLVAVFQDEFIVRRNERTVAYTGKLNPEQVDEDFTKKAVRNIAATVLTDLSRIPENIARMKRGDRRELAAGRLTVVEGTLQTELVLVLLLFRTYIYREIQSPRERWWQE